MMYVQGSVPSELNKYIFIALPKVNGTIKCEKHRTISLMSHVTKLMLLIIINRIRGRTLHEIAHEQYNNIYLKSNIQSVQWTIKTIYNI